MTRRFSTPFSSTDACPIGLKLQLVPVVRTVGTWRTTTGTCSASSPPLLTWLIRTLPGLPRTPCSSGAYVPHLMSACCQGRQFVHNGVRHT